MRTKTWLWTFLTCCLVATTAGARGGGRAPVTGMKWSREIGSSVVAVDHAGGVHSMDYRDPSAPRHRYFGRIGERPEADVKIIGLSSSGKSLLYEVAKPGEPVRYLRQALVGPRAGRFSRHVTRALIEGRAAETGDRKRAKRELRGEK